MGTPLVYVERESAREFTTLQAATDYAMTRATAHRPIVVIDDLGAEYVIVKRDPAWTITLTRQL